LKVKGTAIINFDNKLVTPKRCLYSKEKIFTMPIFGNIFEFVGHKNVSTFLRSKGDDKKFNIAWHISLVFRNKRIRLNFDRFFSDRVKDRPYI